MRTVAALVIVSCLAPMGLGWGCVLGCPDDDVDGPCPPNCTHCVCTSHHPVPGLLSDVGNAPMLAFGLQDPVPVGSPSPGTSPDILHVPRA